MSTDQPFYSIRMRASVTAQHLSGAERIVSKPELDQTISELRSRAMSKAQEPDRIIITIESLHNMSISRLQALPITTVPSKNVDESRDLAVRKLELAGVSANVAESALALLDNGAAASGMNMRGALIMTAGEGKRLEPDRERGVRVSRFDWSTEAQPVIEQQLATAGLGHFRTREALALATKVANAP
ncbi:MAG: 6-carboxyhexanoate--CoA ligase, partial [Nitrospirota bacterium]|nr:6-carboxyhexanoate--CoA ligase [Nitrospirota bacterium]